MLYVETDGIVWLAIGDLAASAAVAVAVPLMRWDHRVQLQGGGGGGRRGKIQELGQVFWQGVDMLFSLFFWQKFCM